jgi:hypothetical protein
VPGQGCRLPLPVAPVTVAAFLATEAEAGKRPSTLGRRLAAIRYFHKLADLPSPTDAEAVKATLRGIRRTLGMAKVIKIVGLIGKKPQFLQHGLAAGRFKGVQQAMATRLHRLP